MASPRPDEASRPGTYVTGARVFEVLWENLVAVVGTAATATLVRRAALRGAARAPELEQLTVEAEGLEYKYSLPESWREREFTGVPALNELIGIELCPLLREFTGSILLRRLERIPELRALGVRSTEIE